MEVVLIGRKSGFRGIVKRLREVKMDRRKRLGGLGRSGALLYFFRDLGRSMGIIPGWGGSL